MGFQLIQCYFVVKGTAVSRNHNVAAAWASSYLQRKHFTRSSSDSYEKPPLVHYAKLYMHYYQVSGRDNRQRGSTNDGICYCELSAFPYVNAGATKGHFPICCHEITLPDFSNDPPWKKDFHSIYFLRKDNSKWNKTVLDKDFQIKMNMCKAPYTARCVYPLCC